jgi:hypothetical protein
VPGSASWLLRSLLFAAALVCTTPVPGGAQEEAPEEAGAWRFTFTPYVWVAGLKGQVGVRGEVAQVDLSFGDIFDQLDLGFMGALEARHGRWMGRVDVFYVSTVDEAAVPLSGTLVGDVVLTQDQTMLQPEVGYALLTRPWGGVDGLVGIRYWHQSVDVSVNSGGATLSEQSGRANWLDGTVGFRIRVQSDSDWRLFARGDVGGGGSKFTWQALAGVGFDFAKCCSAIAAYRHLDVNYQSDQVVDDVYLTGPAIGVEFHL